LVCSKHEVRRHNALIFMYDRFLEFIARRDPSIGIDAFPEPALAALKEFFAEQDEALQGAARN
jgi:hypothetical protein